MMLQQGLLEYTFTIGIILSLAMLLIGAFKDRKQIYHTLKSHGLDRRFAIAALGVVIVFLFVELYFVKPTQLLFFDDAIYQGMAIDMLHMGQAWMCNYGTPLTCFQGQVYHEPIGLSFNIAVAFLIFGVSRASAYGTEAFLGALSVLMCILSALLLFKDRRAALFSGLILAITPVVLVWARPTNSDMATLAYSMVTIFFFLAFVKRKSLWSLSNMLFALSLLLYMKVDEVLFIPILVAMYLLLDSSGIIGSAKAALSSIAKNIWNTKLLIIVLLFVLAVVPSVLYSYNESLTGNYGYQGTTIQNTCIKGMPGMQVNSSIDMQNFRANVCANLGFWLNAYTSDYVMQPILFTLLAVLGAFMLVGGGRWKIAAAIGIWFGAFFFLYTAFYAGSVIYGVDWRFMLSLVAQAALFGGFAVSELVSLAETVAGRIKRHKNKIAAVATAVAVVVIFVPLYMMMPLIAVNPSSIQQAGDARFYENFVYNNSQLIPSSCVVYTYDPTLFNINNRTATQMDNLYNSTQTSQYISEGRCLVFDYGYWCHTPNNECVYANQSYQLIPIKTATYNRTGSLYGFYYLKKK